MSFVLNLPSYLESELAEEAAQFNLSLPDYVLQLLTANRPTRAQPRNGAELVAYWKAEGLIGTRPDIDDSASHARALREQVERHSR